MYVSFKVIGRNICKARKAKGLTQEKVAERLGMSHLHYGRLERGERVASLEQIAHIADALDVSALLLLSGSFPEEPLLAVPSEESIAFAERIARMTAVCTPQELELLKEICEVFSRQSRDSVS